MSDDVNVSLANVPVPDELNAVREQIHALRAREHDLKAILIANQDVRMGKNWLAEIKEITQERTDIKEMRAVHPDIVSEFTFPLKQTRVELTFITSDGELVKRRKLP